MTDIKNTSVIDFEDISDEQMNAMIDGTLTEFDEGDLVDGTVARSSTTRVLVDIGLQRARGVIPVARAVHPQGCRSRPTSWSWARKIEALVLQKGRQGRPA